MILCMLILESKLEGIKTFFLCMLTGSDDKYLGLLREVTQRTAKTVAGWQCVGFVHGVLNTDNMSILGETIDYGCTVWTSCACI